MNKGLEALEDIKTWFSCHDYDQLNELDIIEKELKQAEENEKLLNVFKNALTIEHHLSGPEIALKENNSDYISLVVSETIRIRQNELDKSMRKALREWVLKNAFLKELKAMEIIKKYIFVNKPFGNACYICLNDESEMITEEEYDLLKEIL